MASELIERAVYALSVTGVEQLDRGTQAVDKLAASEDKLKAANDRLAASGERVVAIHTRDEVAKRTATGSIDRLIASMDRQERAHQQLRRTQEQINRLQQEGAATAIQVARANELAVQRYEQQTAAISRTNIAHNDNARAMGTATVSAGQMRASLFNLGQQVQDVGVQLASGTNSLQVFAQQGPQIATAVQLAGGFKAVRSELAAMITPARVAAAGLVAVGAGITAVLSRAGTLETQARQFTVAMEAMGTASLASGADFQRQVRGLQAMGIAADQARASLLAIVRIQGINPAAAGRFVATGADIAAALGGDPAQRATDFAKAAGNGIEATIQFGIAVRAFTATEADLLRRTGDVEVAIDKIERAFAGRLNRTLSTTTRSLSDVGSALGSMWDALALTGPAQAGIRALEHAASVIERLASGKPLFLNLPGFGLPGARMPLALNQAGADLRDTNLRAGWNPNTDAAFAALPPDLPAAVKDQLARLQPSLSSSLGQMISEAAQQGIVLGIGSGLRSTERQAQLYAADLARNGGVPSGRVARPGGSMHERGEAGDLVDAQGRAIQAGSREDQWLAANQSRFGIVRPVTSPWEPWHVERAGARATSGLPDQERLGQLGRETQAMRDQADAAKALGEQAVALKAYYDEFNAGGRTIEAHWSAQTKAAHAVEMHRIELGKAADSQEQATQGTIRAISTATSAADAYRLIAQSQAELRFKAGQTNDVAGEQRRILEEGAASAILAGRQQVLAATPQIEAAERVAVAAKQGAVAQREAEAQAQAATRTQDALAKAEASRNPILIEQAKALNDAALAEIRRSDAARASLANTQAIRGEQENQQVLALQVQMQGQSAEHINTQVTLLRTKLELDKQIGVLGPDEVRNRLDAVAATGQMTEELARAQREQQRIEDGVRSIASTINSELTRSIENAFSGQKVEDWGTRIKRMLGSLAAQISDALFIKPLLGSIVGLFSPNAAQGFGSLFGAGGGGLLGNLFGSANQAPVATLTPNGQGGFSIQTLGQAAGVAKDLAGGGIFGSGSSSGSGLFSNATSWINNNIGTSLGFAPAGLVNGTGAGAGIFTDLATGITSDVAGGGVASGLFGGTTLTGLLGGVGAGFGAGSLLNSLLGGNKLLGSVGSGIGSLAGSIIGSIVPGIGTLIGGLLGGAGGGLLGGLFGNSKPRNASAGGGIDLATGRISPFQGGDPAIDQATLQALQQLGQGLAVLKTIPGNTLSGDLLFQNGKNTGATIDWSGLTGVSGIGDAGRMSLGKDPAQAALTIFETLARGLTGVSDTVRKIIDNTTDLTKLAENLSFAPIYDNIKTAFDSAFQNLPSQVEQGPFGQAADQVKTTFDELAAKAREFTLDVVPITAAYDEAFVRVQGDYQTSLSQQEAQLIGGTDFLGAALQAHQQQVMNWSDSVRLGFDSASDAARVNRIELAQLGAAFSNLDLAQLTKAVSTFAESAPEVSQFAQALIDAGQYLPSQIDQLILAITDPIRLAIEKEQIAGEERVRIAQATGQDIVAINKYNALTIEQIWTQATQSLTALRDELTAGASSGLTAVEQLKAANDNFQQELVLVQAGNLAEISNLATAASALINLSLQTYGNAPQTADLRTQILSAINPILTTQGFASGTISTPPGTILVGERGPELITQSGGLRVWSNPETERMLAGMPGWHFADGTFAPPPIAQTQNNASIEQKLDRLIALMEGNLVVSREHGAVSERGFERVASAVEQGNAPAFEAPQRRRA